MLLFAQVEQAERYGQPRIPEESSSEFGDIVKTMSAGSVSSTWEHQSIGIMESFDSWADDAATAQQLGSYDSWADDAATAQQLGSYDSWADDAATLQQLGSYDSWADDAATLQQLGSYDSWADDAATVE
jgi:hypothetical protein